MKKLFVAMMTACLLSCTALTVPAWALPAPGTLTINFDSHITKVVFDDSIEFTASGQTQNTGCEDGYPYQVQVTLTDGYIIDQITGMDYDPNASGFAYGDGGGTITYIGPDSFSILASNGGVNGTLTITSRLPETYTVTFKDWDGEVLKTEEVTEGSGATAPTSPTRDYYTFTGWDKPFDEVTEDLTVTATYTEGFSGDCETCTGSGKVSGLCSLCNGLGSRDCPDCENGTSFQSCFLCGGSGTRSESCTMCGGSGGFMDEPSQTWMSCASCGGSGMMEESCSQCSGTGQEAQACTTCSGTGQISCPETEEVNCSVCSGSGHVTYYHVIFADHDGTELFSANVPSGHAAPSPSAPVREGYTFTGWDKSFDDVTGNLTVTAQYIEDPEPEPEPSCEECGGTGTVTAPCESCEGTGGLPCDLCEGRGWYLVAVPNEPGKQVTCPDCDGEGTIPCPDCEGTGVIEILCPVCSGEQPTPPDEDSDSVEDEDFDLGAWWTERTEPEKWILGIAGGLLVLAILKGLIR